MLSESQFSLHPWPTSIDCPRKQRFRCSGSGLLLITVDSSAPADQNHRFFLSQINPMNFPSIVFERLSAFLLKCHRLGLLQFSACLYSKTPQNNPLSWLFQPQIPNAATIFPQNNMVRSIPILSQILYNNFCPYFLSLAVNKHFT